jgi:hypothetical protein
MAERTEDEEARDHRIAAEAGAVSRTDAADAGPQSPPDDRVQDPHLLGLDDGGDAAGLVDRDGPLPREG